MKRVVLFFVCLSVIVGNIEAQVRIVDADDGSPIAAASLFDKSGNMVGFTWSDGVLSNVPVTAYPLSVRCMGYEPIIIDTPEEKVWKMSSTSYGLDEVVIVPVKRNVLHQTFYVREYFSMTTQEDTITLFAERMADRFVPTEKKSKFRGSKQLRILTSESYTRFRTDGKDSLVCGDELFPSLLSLMDLDDDSLDEPEEFKHADESTKYYEEKDKTGAAIIVRQNGQMFSYTEDLLAGREGHTWTPLPLKLFGLTMEVQQFYFQQGYRVNDKGLYMPQDLSEAGFVMEAMGSGKAMRRIFDTNEPVSIRVMVELYVVDNDFLSVEEAKEEQKSTPSHVEFVIPSSVPALNEATRLMMKRAKMQTDGLMVK